MMALAHAVVFLHGSCLDLLPFVCFMHFFHLSMVARRAKSAKQCSPINTSNNNINYNSKNNSNHNHNTNQIPPPPPPPRVHHAKSARYSSQWNWLGWDAKNEPHGKATWGSGDPSTDFARMVEDFFPGLMRRYPGKLLFVEGIDR
jgi:hypothetical protein